MFSRFGSRKDCDVEYSCTIRLLDDNEVLQCDFQKSHKGQFLLDYTCNALNLLEKDYFGMRFVDADKQRHWLDPTKSIWKQVKGLDPVVFCFRVKFYPPDPYRLKEEITRYQMFLQLRRDLLHGRLYCSQNDSALLAAYIIQSELGDFDSEEHTGGYVTEYKLLLKQTPRCEEKIAEIHQTQLRGQVPAVAEINFLRKACTLDTYGVDPHPVKDHKSNSLYLGINHAGILTFQGSRKIHHFKWQDIQKINFEAKMFIIHLFFSDKKQLIGFKCSTQAACQHLWRCAVEQRYFFNMNTSTEVPSVTTGGGIFSRASKFRYSGRVEKEILEDMKDYKRDPPSFERTLTRTASFRQKTGLESPASEQDLEERLSSVTFNSPSSLGFDESIQEEPAISDSPTDDRDYPPETPERNHLHQVQQQQQQQQQQQMDLFENSDLFRNQFEAIDTKKLEDPFSKELLMNNFISSVEEQAAADRLVSEKEVHHSHPLHQMSQTHSIRSHRRAVRIMTVASLFLLLLLSCLLIVVLESDSPLFSELRKLPELIILRREYYEPTKEFIIDRVNVIFHK